MELYQLRSFVAIARERNLTRAADLRHLSPSALSCQIKALEEELGVSLFERTARGMRLSEPGRILLSHAQGTLEAAGVLQRTAETLSRGITASVTIGLNTDPTFLRVSEINQRLALLRSDLNVIFHTSETTSTAQSLRNGTIDLGFFYGPLQAPDIDHAAITQVRICVVIPSNLAAAGPPRDWQELADLPWVWVSDKFPFYQVMQEKMGGFRMAPGRIVTAANEQIVRELVIAGQGVGIMREDEARPLAASGKALIWDKGWGSVPLNLGWREGNRDKGPVKAVREAIGYIWRKSHEEGDGSLADKAWA
ncbi:LysR family transcriptional regulator [Desulfuromonas sp.]|uniref:LysR family transcriptional regulator n=1 Tax=Desulfuromonas sp. TaxID=892 RepID=UPI0025C6CF43|nr:LysR family transcriptional regulator [Desulfuromonas sp.]